MIEISFIVSPQLAWYTGSSLPETSIFSTGSTLTLVFYSDQLVTKKGFTLEYTACNNFTEKADNSKTKMN